MRNIFRRSIIKPVFCFMLIAAVIAAGVYGCFQLRGLKSRATTVENRVNELENNGYYADEMNSDASQVKFTVESQETRSLRVQDSYYQMDVTYTEKPTLVVTVKIKNDTDWVFDITSADLRAQTDKGLLITQAMIHEDDANVEELYLSLAPGAEYTTKLYFVAPQGQKIVKLYNGSSQKNIELN